MLREIFKRVLNRHGVLEDVDPLVDELIEAVVLFFENHFGGKR